MIMSDSIIVVIALYLYMKKDSFSSFKIRRTVYHCSAKVAHFNPVPLFKEMFCTEGPPCLDLLIILGGRLKGHLTHLLELL